MFIFSFGAHIYGYVVHRLVITAFLLLRPHCIYAHKTSIY